MPVQPSIIVSVGEVSSIAYRNCCKERALSTRNSSRAREYGQRHSAHNTTASAASLDERNISSVPAASSSTTLTSSQRVPGFAHIISVAIVPLKNAIAITYRSPPRFHPAYSPLTAAATATIKLAEKIASSGRKVK